MTWRRGGIFLFLMTGMAAAGYLTYTHFAAVEPQCYGIGDCAYVQASSYAKIFGIPIALLGLLAYGAILVLTVAAFWGLQDEAAEMALQGAFGLAFAGTLYSAYLTGIEAFVLRAYCIYCVISAISITLVCILLAMEVWKPNVVEEEEHATH